MALQSLNKSPRNRRRNRGCRLIRRRPIPNPRQILDRAYRTLVHALYYIGSNETETYVILETARRELFREKFQFTKYPQYGHHCKKCQHYRRHR
jgi:hypothetical protein